MAAIVIDSKKAELDLKAAPREADFADEDAEFAISYAYWAVEEAEYTFAQSPARHHESALSMPFRAVNRLHGKVQKGGVALRARVPSLNREFSWRAGGQ